MFKKKSSENIENNLKALEAKIKALSVQMKNVDQEVEVFFKEVEVNLEKLAIYSSDKENFSEESWRKLSDYKQQLDDKLKVELDNVNNPLKIKRARSSLQVQRHWLYVK